MSQNSMNDLGNKIADSVRDALHSGDLSHLKDISPAVQDAVKNIPGLGGNAEGRSAPPSPPKPPPNAGASPQNQNAYNQQYGRPAQQHGRPAQHPPAWYGSSAKPRRFIQGPSAGTGVLPMVLGILGTVASGVCLLVFGILALATASIGFGFAAGGTLLTLVASSIVTGAGNQKRKLAGRVRHYYSLLAQNQTRVQTFDDLALHTGLPTTEIKKDVKKAMVRKMMPDVRMDQTETCVMQGEEAYRLYIETEKNRQKRESKEAELLRRRQDPATAGIEAFREEGAATIAKIRAANDAIPGEEISNKLYQLESTTTKIFEYVQKCPTKLPDTRRFMSYYLPTTLKLVEKYRQYENMEIQVASVQKAKTEIEQTLDTINTAFINLLDSLYQDDTLDVSTDIEVLQSMLEQEGLTGKKFDINQPESDASPFTITAD